MGAIVVGIDGSQGSRRALSWAVREAGAHGWPVEAVTVEPDGGREIVQPIAGARTVPERPFEERASEAGRILDEVVEEVLAESGATSVPVERKVVEGEPAEVLLEEASDAELLVLGARGLGAVRSLVLGSVSQECVSHATTPVVIIPPAAQP